MGQLLPAWLYLAFYRSLTWLVSRFYAVAWRVGLLGAAREPLHAERLGRWDSPGLDSVASPVWLHAASVGEVALAAPVIRAFKQASPETAVILTCNTPTGRRVAQSTEADEVFYFPLDSPWILKPILDRMRPRLVVFVETEIWPALLMELASRKVPTAVVNARISAGSFKWYRRVRPLMAAVLGTLALASVRDPESYDRLMELGVDPGRSFLVGDLKYDGVTPEEAENTGDLLAPICGGASALLAASTHEGEDEMVLDAYKQARATFPGLRLVVAPRHPHRSDSIVGLAQERGLSVERWSKLDGRNAWQVLVVDTVGELRGFMVSAVGAFVGGSLVDVGGHNLVEPAAFALPIATGPHLVNVAGQAKELQGIGALQIVDGAEELGRVFERWLTDRSSASGSGEGGRDLIAAGSGALARTMDLLEPFAATC